MCSCRCGYEGASQADGTRLKAIAGRPRRDAAVRPRAQAHRFPQLRDGRAQARRAPRGADRRQRLGQDQSARGRFAARPGSGPARPPLWRALPQGRAPAASPWRPRWCRARTRSRSAPDWPPARSEESAGRTVRIAGKEQSAGALGRARPARLAHPGHGRPVHRCRLPSGGVSSTGWCSPSTPRCARRSAATTGPCGSGTACSRCGRDRRALFEGLEEQMAEAGVAIAAARLDAVARLAALIERMRAARGEGPFPWALIALEGTLEEALARAARDRGRGRVSRPPRARAASATVRRAGPLKDRI